MKLTVIGLPIPQGSKNARIFGSRLPNGAVVNPRIALTDGSAKKHASLKSWRDAIAAEARKWCLGHMGTVGPLDGPVELRATFYLPRPKSMPKRVQFPVTRPDLDKLTRAIGDALSKIAYTEDSRIVEMHVAKRFAIDSPPRVEIEIGLFKEGGCENDKP